MCCPRLIVDPFPLLVWVLLESRCIDVIQGPQLVALGGVLLAVRGDLAIHILVSRI